MTKFVWPALAELVFVTGPTTTLQIMVGGRDASPGGWIFWPFLDSEPVDAAQRETISLITRRRRKVLFMRYASRENECQCEPAGRAGPTGTEGTDVMASTIAANGNGHTVAVDGDTPLLWVLRDVLGMTGAKFGCGMALGGACSVQIDGVRRVPVSPRSTASVRGRPQQSRRSARRRPAPGFRRLGSIMKSSSAATVNRDRSCPPRRCWQAGRIRPTPTLTML
jgi:hypothetical protein